MVEHTFRVRWYQRSFHETFVQQKKRRLIEIAHRRWGKDEIVLNGTRDLALQRPASYWHCLPEYAQARKALWTAVNPHTGKRRIDEAFPPEIRASTNEQEMFIKLTSGSTWQLVGSDNYNTLVGAGVAGVVFSEWALANPSAWGYIRPMIEENNGWAAFISTPRGNNHCKSMFDMARGNDNWFAELSDVRHTGALSKEQLGEALREYQALFGIDFGQAMFEQEYLCSFNAAMVGAYWGAEINKAERDGRICAVGVDPRYPVHTAWDLGNPANNPIWCFQVIPGEPGPRIVDFYRPDSEDLEDWCDWLTERGYTGSDFVPHDIFHQSWGAKRTRVQMMQDYKRKPIPIKKVSLSDGLTAGRETIKVARFDAERCELGINGLRAYRREWDDELKVFRATPVKDWSEHIGSAFRYLGLAWKEVLPTREPPPDPFLFEGDANGTIRANITIREMIERQGRKRRSDDD